MAFIQDQLMYEKGYRYRLETVGSEPLYSKTLHELGPLMRSYPGDRFTVEKIVYDWKISDLFKLWADSRTSVINVLSEDHPGLVAAFMAQGLADKVFTRQDLNTIANLLIEKRVSLVKD